MPSFTPVLVVARPFGPHAVGDTIEGHDAIVAALAGPHADAVRMRRDPHDAVTGQRLGQLVAPGEAFPAAAVRE